MATKKKARKKPAKKAAKKARRPVGKKKAAKTKPARKASRRAAKRRVAPKKAAKKKTAKKSAKKAARKPARKAAKKPARKSAKTVRSATPQPLGEGDWKSDDKYTESLQDWGAAHDSEKIAREAEAELPADLRNSGNPEVADSAARGNEKLEEPDEEW